MADYAFPTAAHNNRVVTPREYEDLTATSTSTGVFGYPTDPPLVYADSTLRGVKVRANRYAFLRGLRWEAGDTERSIPLDANTTPGTSRIDLIVLRMTRNPWNATPAVVKGAASATPVTPSPTYGTDTSTGVWELPLAAVTVPYNDTLTDAAQCVPKAWYVGSYGQIRCTPDTRPRHEAGLTVWDTVEGYLLSTGGRWLVAAEDSGKLSLPLASGWAASFNTLRRRNGWVYLAISPQRTGAALAADATSTVGTLPEGFLPAEPLEGLAYSASAGPSRIYIQPNGLVQVVLYSGLGTSRFVNFHPISFPAA